MLPYWQGRILAHFYPRSPRGERQILEYKALNPQLISIHAPREGSDIQGLTCFSIRSAFLSTLPARGATYSRSYLV